MLRWAASSGSSILMSLVRWNTEKLNRSKGSGSGLWQNEVSNSFWRCLEMYEWETLKLKEADEAESWWCSWTKSVFLFQQINIKKTWGRSGHSDCLDPVGVQREQDSGLTPENFIRTEAEQGPIRLAIRSSPSLEVYLDPACCVHEASWNRKLF